MLLGKCDKDSGESARWHSTEMVFQHAACAVCEGVKTKADVGSGKVESRGDLSTGHRNCVGSVRAKPK